MMIGRGIKRGDLYQLYKLIMYKVHTELYRVEFKSNKFFFPPLSNKSSFNFYIFYTCVLTMYVRSPSECPEYFMTIGLTETHIFIPELFFLVFFFILLT